MKKLLAITILSLLYCNVGLAEIIKPFDLWCKSYKKLIGKGDGSKTEPYSETYQIHITDDQAFIVGLEGLYNNLMRTKDSDETTYHFSSIGFDGKRTVTENGTVRPFDALLINRTNGEATLIKFVLNLEKISMRCSTEKPKLLF